MNVPAAAGEQQQGAVELVGLAHPRHRAVGLDERLRRLVGSMPAVISDWNQPGHRALTRTLRRANCSASSRVRLTTAPLLAQ